MPTYDYLCAKCGHRFDEMQKFSDPPLTKCPKCKGKVKRVISGGVGVVFKGSGFYVTDSRPSGGGKSGESSTKEPAKTEATATTPKAEPAKTEKSERSEKSEKSEKSKKER